MRLSGPTVGYDMALATARCASAMPTDCPAPLRRHLDRTIDRDRRLLPDNRPSTTSRRRKPVEQTAEIVRTNTWTGAPAAGSPPTRTSRRRPSRKTADSRQMAPHQTAAPTGQGGLRTHSRPRSKLLPPSNCAATTAQPCITCPINSSWPFQSCSIPWPYGNTAESKMAGYQ